MSHAMSFTKRLPVVEILLAALVLTFAFVSPGLIPYNMDEFSAYHVLGCKYNHLSDVYNTFAAGCAEYDLRLPGTSTFLPLRSYIYIGVAQTLPFWFFWALFHDPVAGRVQGAVYLILATYLLARLVNVRWRHAMYATLLFPTFCLSFILDTGPVGISLCALLLLPLLTRAAVAADRPRDKAVMGVLIGVVAFVAISIKPVFLWAAPALALWILWLMRPSQAADWRMAGMRQVPLILGAVLACALPLVILLASFDRTGSRFVAVAGSGGLSLRPTSLLSQAYFLGKVVVDSTAFYARAVTLKALPLVDAIPAIVGVVALAAGGLWRREGARRPLLFMLSLCVLLVVSVLISNSALTGLHVVTAVLCGALILSVLMIGLWRTNEPQRQLAAFLLGLACLTFVITAANRSAWAPHHVVYAFVFAVAAVAIALAHFASRSVVGIVLALGCLCWASLAARLPQADVHVDTNFDKDRLTRFIRTSHLDATTVQAHVDWGTYYISHTFGDRNQLVVTLYDFSKTPEADRRQEIAQIKTIAGNLRRDVLLITQTDNSLRDDATIVAALGQPIQTYPFNTWQIARYHP